MEKRCIICGKKIEGSRIKVKNVKYCSHTCAGRAHIIKVMAKRTPYRANIKSANVGALHELSVASDLFKKGFYVFRNMSPIGPCDLITLKDDELLRIEVATTTQRKDGTYWLPQKSKNHSFDILAVILGDGSIHYHPSID